MILRKKRKVKLFTSNGINGMFSWFWFFVLQLICQKGLGCVTLLSLLMMSFSPTAVAY